MHIACSNVYFYDFMLHHHMNDDKGNLCCSIFANLHRREFSFTQFHWSMGNLIKITQLHSIKHYLPAFFVFFFHLSPLVLSWMNYMQSIELISSQFSLFRPLLVFHVVTSSLRNFHLHFLHFWNYFFFFSWQIFAMKI